MSIKRTLLLTIALLLLIPSSRPALATSQPGITVQYTYFHQERSYPYEIEFRSGEEPRIVDGRVLVPVQILAEHLDLKVDNLPESRSIKIIDEFGKNVELAYGQKQTTVNGRQVFMDAPAEEINGVAFVPLRFVAESFDMEVDWQASDRTVHILNHVISTPKYILDRRSFSLLLRGEPGEEHQQVADFSDGANWDNVMMTVTTTAQGNDVVAIRNNHGEPHLLNDSYFLYIADGKVVAQSFIYSSLAWNKFTGVSADGSRVVLCENNKATVFDDRTTQAVAQYDLSELCAPAYADIPIVKDYICDGNTNYYEIEGYGDNYLLITGSYHLLHMVAYPDSGQLDVVYKEVFSPEEQDIFERGYVEGPMGADVVRMEYVGERDGYLVFNCNLERLAGHDLEYQYQLK